MTIRTATMNDLNAITAVEAECFPAAEAALCSSCIIARRAGIASAFYGLAVPDAGSSLCNVKNILLLYTGYFLHILCTLV